MNAWLVDGNHYKFTGKERDNESGLDNFGFRYDSSTGSVPKVVEKHKGELAEKLE